MLKVGIKAAIIKKAEAFMMMMMRNWGFISFGSDVCGNRAVVSDSSGIL